jgi:tRNA U34 5-methylaminomethyl-2-thiouridine-forming methyltransferase MnmC
MKTSTPLIIQTKDGSQSLFLPELNEHYHSMYGAKTESEHIYISMGLDYVASSKEHIKILEIGFGTGLNVLCTYMASLRLNKQIEYETLELYPLKQDIWSVLQYPLLWPENPEMLDLFEYLHEKAPDQTIYMGKYLHVIKRYISLHEFVPLQTYDVIYFDAFAPEKQPDLWTPEVFSKLFDAMNKGGVLVTYCCKGEVKRMLKTAGFTIEKVNGPVGGKREMLRAHKD